MKNTLKSEQKNLNYKFLQFIYKNTNNLSKPQMKFLKDFLLGVILSKCFFLNAISRSLKETISPKKTAERLNYHLSKKSLGIELNKQYLKSHKSMIKNYDFIIYDGSDITKKYATKMEGLKKIRDGSKSIKGKNHQSNGYHWHNYIAVNDDGILPLFSDIYSFDLDEDCKKSENMKIINTVNFIREHSEHNNSILVIDRGGDRRVLIDNFIENEQYFIIRQSGTRNLFLEEKCIPLKKIYKKIDLNYKFTCVKIKKNKKYTKTFMAGAIKVKMPKTNLKDKIDKDLWLVTAQEPGKGFAWFLAYLSTDNIEEVIKVTMDGYSKRWKIEEFHRQIKQDFKLEKIAYQKYETIRNIGSIIVLLMGFIGGLEFEFAKTIIKETNQYYRSKISDIPKYFYYRLVEAINIIASKWEKRRKKKPKIKDRQLYLKFKFDW